MECKNQLEIEQDVWIQIFSSFMPIFHSSCIYFLITQGLLLHLKHHVIKLLISGHSNRPRPRRKWQNHLLCSHTQQPGTKLWSQPWKWHCFYQKDVWPWKWGWSPWLLGHNQSRRSWGISAAEHLVHILGENKRFEWQPPYVWYRILHADSA